MSLYLHTEIEILAPAETVWRHLTDFERYPEWNPFIKSASGELRERGRLELRIEPPGGRRALFRPIVIRLRPNRELRWLGRVLLPGVFDGEHSFVIDPRSDSRVTFTQGERYAGVLVSMARRKLFDRTRQGFEKMNEALKARAEGSGSS